MKKIQNILKDQLVITDNSSSNETSVAEVKFQQNMSRSKPKERKIIHWVRKSFAPSNSTLIGGLPPSPIDSKPEPTDYFHSIFGKEFFEISKDQSNLYCIQVNPNRPVNRSDFEISIHCNFDYDRCVFFSSKALLLDEYHSCSANQLNNELRLISAN